MFISIAAQCGETGFLSSLFVFSKKALYSTPPATGTSIYRATYYPSSAWFRSLSVKDQDIEYIPGFGFGGNAYNFNTWVLPSKPQSAEDTHDAVFVMGNVSGARVVLSVLCAPFQVCLTECCFVLGWPAMYVACRAYYARQIAAAAERLQRPCKHTHCQSTH